MNIIKKFVYKSRALRHRDLTEHELAESEFLGWFCQDCDWTQDRKPSDWEALEPTKIDFELDPYEEELDDEIDIVHVVWKDGKCRVSVNGQGHLPCNIPEHSNDVPTEDLRGL